jgi:hypothetical protein
MPKRRRRIRNPDIVGLKVDWLVASITSTVIILTFGILVNSMSWIYFSLDPKSEPKSRHDIWKRIERGGDGNIRRLMYELLIFAEIEKQNDLHGVYLGY